MTDMNILVFNCGSSSLKYRLINLPSEREIAAGEAQRIGPPTSRPSAIVHKCDDTEYSREISMRDHATAYKEVINELTTSSGIKPDAIGHRLVHGGTRFITPTRINDSTLGELEKIRGLAPIHNPPAIDLIRACTEQSPGIPQVAVFDTAYHSTIPDYAGEYALPQNLRKEMGYRKYGFHGTSHRFVVEEAANYLGIPISKFNAVSCHLGSGGASLCAVVNGESLDNSMGYSPLQGLVMSTRSGDLDPAIPLRMLSMNPATPTRITDILNRRSGVLALSGLSSDIRDIFTGITPNRRANPRLQKTTGVYLWRTRKYLGAYLAAVQDPHAVVFTDTIGETMPGVRLALCSDMNVFGMEIDSAANETLRILPADIATPGSRVRILVIRTNEELAIARQSFEIFNN